VERLIEEDFARRTGRPQKANAKSKI